MKILIVQTSFIGDVILATGLVEKLHHYYPAAKIDFLLRKGNEGVLSDHPFLHKVLIWDKKKNKFSNLIKLIKQVRAEKYDQVINLQRFFSTGLITVLSGAKGTSGFDKNPLSFLFNRKYKHQIGNGKHEIERNHELIEDITDSHPAKPKVYPSEADIEEVREFKTGTYICIAPTSVWFTKQLPAEKWIDLIKNIPSNYNIYLLGAPADFEKCEEIKTTSGNSNVINLAGKLTLLQSACLIGDAKMNYANDSAPLHLASAMNAPVTAVFCSTVPAFGFGPLSDKSNIVQTTIDLPCKPCGIHGYQKCPLGHFKCALTIETQQLLDKLQ